MNRSIIPLSHNDRFAIGRASQKLRYVYGIQTKKMARDIHFGLYYLHQVERGAVPIAPSDNAVLAISNYFDLDFVHLIAIGNNCNTPIATFLYLQKIGRLNNVNN